MHVTPACLARHIGSNLWRRGSSGVRLPGPELRNDAGRFYLARARVRWLVAVIECELLPYVSCLDACGEHIKAPSGAQACGASGSSTQLLQVDTESLHRCNCCHCLQARDRKHDFHTVDYRHI